MPRLISAGSIVEDQWLPVDAENPAPAIDRICTLDQWLDRQDKSGSAVQIEPGQSPAPLFASLEQMLETCASMATAVNCALVGTSFAISSPICAAVALIPSR